MSVIGLALDVEWVDGEWRLGEQLEILLCLMGLEEVQRCV